MRPLKFSLLLVLLALALSITPTMALARSTLINVADPNTISDADLARFVDLAFEEKITVPQTQAFYESLTAEQKEKVASLVAIRTGMPLDRLRSEANFSNKLEPLLGIWTEDIENVWTWGFPPGSTFGSYYYNDPQCDENGDPDNDWVFTFTINSSNPDGLRWTTTSSWVYLVFMAAYGGNLKGFAYNYSEARLCIGPDGVSAAGGPYHVLTTVFLHY